MAVLQREISLDLVYRYLVQVAPGDRGKDRGGGAGARGADGGEHSQPAAATAAAAAAAALPARFALGARFPMHRWQEAMRAFAAAAHRSPPAAGPTIPLDQRPAWRTK